LLKPAPTRKLRPNNIKKITDTKTNKHRPTQTDSPLKKKMVLDCEVKFVDFNGFKFD